MIIKLIAKKGKSNVYVSTSVEEVGNMLHLRFPYNAYLKDEVKAMDGARWDPDLKIWKVRNSPRNWFQFRFLMGENPYAWYDQPLVEASHRVNLYKQQDLMASQGITYRQTIWAAEMGLGKTLAAFMTMEWAGENLGYDDWWWVGPLSALAAFHLEVRKWGLKVYPTRILTYEALVRVMKEWEDGAPAPHGVIFDEFSRCKTPGSQRSLAGYHLTNSMRVDHGENNPFIIGMTGTPAPKSPLDWYWLCEIIKPGFIREGNIHKFRDRLAHQVRRENLITGGVYPELLGWKDNAGKCNICGMPESTHDIDVVTRGLELHSYQPGVNEIAKLYKRMRGLVHVYFKRDWLKELPEKQYRVLTCKVSNATKNAAAVITAGAQSTIQALTFLRELSDGFQYRQVESGTTTCKVCNGTKLVEVPYVDDVEQELEGVPNPPPDREDPNSYRVVKLVEIECTNCDGTGIVPNYVRDVEVVTSPKDAILVSILEDHEDDGRLVIYGGFTGTIDRLCALVETQGWKYIRVDGRGWATNISNMASDPTTLLEFFQNGRDKVAFIGHPRSAGMGITLTAACETVYYSNSFNGEDRMQSEDRIHRPGMDINRGATITDIVHLPSDQLILDNLREKKRLQSMTLGQFNKELADLPFSE